MEKEMKNLPMDEEESQDALVDYDSDSSVVTVVERERGCEKTISKDEEEKENKKETEARGAIPKHSNQKPKVVENVDVTNAWVENRPVLPIGTKLLYEKQEKMVAKVDSVLKMLDKVMTQATSMMENMIEVAHVNLEKERLKIRRLEVNKQNTQSKVENSIQTVKESEVEPKKKKLDETICSAEKNRSLETIKSALEAVSINVPELRNVDLIRRQTNLKEMNTDEIKSFMMQLEAEIKSENRDRDKLEKPEIR
ncbi:uncharacterized protein LOC112458463, partial [Temnothorax curvispinosus]|uniref:Uncharacterized protein LOC112458463 n=1 Tax=Temnothorax curvispinosus TaxID=300111 RepID=A0A6J1Q942_9HYME